MSHDYYRQVRAGVCKVANSVPQILYASSCRDSDDGSKSVMGEEVPVLRAMRVWLDLLPS